MNILSILALLGGVALFLFGMHVMSGGLEGYPVTSWKEGSKS